MPQLTVTGDQVDPLTRRRLFFFKRKDMNILRREGRNRFSSTGNGTYWWHSPASPVPIYLFAALGEAKCHHLSREELPDGGRQGRPHSRFVARGQRVELERLSQLLDPFQSVSPLPHPQGLINHLYATCFGLFFSKVRLTTVENPGNRTKPMTKSDLYWGCFIHIV